MTLEETRQRFWVFAETCRHLRVYEQIVEGCARNDEMMAFMEAAPRGQRRPNLLLASVHNMLLAGAEHELAAWYPSVSDNPPPPGDPIGAFVDFVGSHGERITEDLRVRSTQTNEPNRSCLWRAAIPEIASRDRPLALFELGASAGLNLAFDRYAYEFSYPTDGSEHVEHSGSANDASAMRSNLRLGLPQPLLAIPEISVRRGLDLNPADLTDAETVRWLKACIWPEQLGRHQRFDAAVANTRIDPPEVIQGDLIDGLFGLVEAASEDSHVVLFNSWVMFYVERSRRETLEHKIEEVAQQFPRVTWFFAEGPGVVEWAGNAEDYLTEPHSVLGYKNWVNGKPDSERVVGKCHAHLEWLDWSF